MYYVCMYVYVNAVVSVLNENFFFSTYTLRCRLLNNFLRDIRSYWVICVHYIEKALSLVFY